MDQPKWTCDVINLAEGTERFSGNGVLFKRMLMKFPEDGSFAALREALREKDAVAAFAAAHTLKGLAGNLSMTRLSADIYPLVERLRAGDLSGTGELFEPVRRDYEEIIAVLAAL